MYSNVLARAASPSLDESGRYFASARAEDNHGLGEDQKVLISIFSKGILDDD